MNGLFSEAPSESYVDFLGSWDPSTNTPTLADGAGTLGALYIASAAGSVDLGSGTLAVKAGDWILYDGSVWNNNSYLGNVYTAGTGLTLTALEFSCDITQYADSDAVTAIKADADWDATDWDTAYSWGDHSAESYLTDLTAETFASLSDIPAHPGVATKILETTVAGYAYIDTPSSGATELSGLSDVNTSTATDKYVLVADGTDWESRLLVEADISDLGTYLTDITGEGIDSLSDVDLTSKADTKILQFNSTSGNLEYVAIPAAGNTDLTEFVDQTAWRVFYSDSLGDVTELALGADGSYLKSNGETYAPSFSVPSGAGNVLQSGTPVDNQLAIWTASNYIEGTSGLTYDGANLLLTGDIGATASRITKLWAVDLTCTNAIAADITGNAGTVTTITGLAPDTATTAVAQPNITSLGTLSSLAMTTNSVTDIADEDDMTSDSASNLATQQSIKAYVDASGSSGLAVTDGTYHIIQPGEDTLSDGYTAASVGDTVVMTPGNYTLTAALTWSDAINLVTLTGNCDATLTGTYNVAFTADNIRIQGLDVSGTTAGYLDIATALSGLVLHSVKSGSYSDSWWTSKTFSGEMYYSEFGDYFCGISSSSNTPTMSGTLAHNTFGNYMGRYTTATGLISHNTFGNYSLYAGTISNTCKIISNNTGTHFTGGNGTFSGMSIGNNYGSFGVSGLTMSGLCLGDTFEGTYPAVGTGGLYLRCINSSEAVFNEGNLTLNGDFGLEDSHKLLLGTGSDAGLWFDGTHLHVDARLVGTGQLILDNLPTADPTVAGAVWNNSNVLTLSTGA